MHIDIIWKHSKNIKKLIVLEFNDTSTIVGHFVSSPREKEKRDRQDSIGDEREGQNRNESEEKGEIKHSTSTFTCYIRIASINAQPLPEHAYSNT